MGAVVVLGLILAFMCALAQVGSVGVATLNGLGRQIEGAQAEVLRAQAEATRAAIARIDRSNEIDLQVKQKSAEAAARAWSILWEAIAFSGVIALLGGAAGMVRWVNKRASTVYADARGQFPVITTSGPGWTVYHDPNRALGSTSAIRTPTVLDATVGAAIATARALRNRSTPTLPTAEPSAAFPLAGSEPTMLQLTTQAQAAQVEAARQSGRPKVMLTAVQGQQILHERAEGTAHRARMPRIAVVNDPEAIEGLERKLLSAGGGDD
jgi:hypothetical protein